MASRAAFDLISCAFTLMSFLFFLKYCRQDRRSTVWLPLTVLTFVAGVLDKETSYSVLLLVPALLLSFRFWEPGKAFRKERGPGPGTPVCVRRLHSMGARFAGSPAGSEAMDSRDPSAPHIAVTWKSIYSLLVNVTRFAGFQRECDRLHRTSFPDQQRSSSPGTLVARRLFLQRGAPRSKTAPPVWFRGTGCRSGHRCDRMDQPIAPAHQARVCFLGPDPRWLSP